MSLDAFLFLVLMALAVPNWLVAAILSRAAWHKPRIRFLTVTAAGSILVASGIGAYVLAVINARYDYVIPQDVARIVLRLVLIGVALYPFVWLRDYWTGRFRDGER